jgi:hypothetical protein
LNRSIDAVFADVGTVKPAFVFEDRGAFGEKFGARSKGRFTV